MLCPWRPDQTRPEQKLLGTSMYFQVLLGTLYFRCFEVPQGTLTSHYHASDPAFRSHCSLETSPLPSRPLAWTLPSGGTARRRPTPALNCISLGTSSVGTTDWWHCTQETETCVESHLLRDLQRGHSYPMALHAGDRHLCWIASP